MAPLAIQLVLPFLIAFSLPFSHSLLLTGRQILYGARVVTFEESVLLAPLISPWPLLEHPTPVLPFPPDFFFGDAGVHPPNQL